MDTHRLSLAASSFATHTGFLQSQGFDFSPWRTKASLLCFAELLSRNESEEIAKVCCSRFALTCRRGRLRSQHAALPARCAASTLRSKHNFATRILRTLPDDPLHGFELSFFAPPVSVPLSALACVRCSWSVGSVFAAKAFTSASLPPVLCFSKAATSFW